MKVSVCFPAEGYPNINTIAITSAMSMSNIHEIIIAGAEEAKIEVVDGIRIVALTPDNDEMFHYSAHASLLHNAIDVATGDYILLADSDVNFLNDISGFYLELMDKYNLSIVGCAHYRWEDQCYKSFPCVINCLIRKEDLPSKEFLKGDLRMRNYLRYGFGQRCVDTEGTLCDGKWLAQTPILKYSDLYPHPIGFFDVGHNLWLWNHLKEGKWISFLPHENNTHFYSSGNFDSNLVDVSIDSDQGLIWHKTMLTSWSDSPYNER